MSEIPGQLGIGHPDAGDFTETFEPDDPGPMPDDVYDERCGAVLLLRQHSSSGVSTERWTCWRSPGHDGRHYALGIEWAAAAGR